MRVLAGKGQDRREFFRAAIRYALLGLLAVAAALTGRKPQNGQRCVNRGICGSCGAFAGCGLPQALSAKRAQIGG
jgi:hypothetical protein